jgi:hypothetical protein
VKDAHQGTAEEIARPIPVGAVPLQLRVTVTAGAVCQFSYSLDGEVFHPVGAPFQAREGRWIGAKVGLFAVRPADAPVGGLAHVEYFRVQ